MRSLGEGRTERCGILLEWRRGCGNPSPLIRRRSWHKTETRRACKAFGRAPEVGDNLYHVINPVLQLGIVGDRAIATDKALERRELLLHIGDKTKEVLGKCHQIGELLLVVAHAVLVGGTLLRQEGTEPIHCTLLPLNNVLECHGRQGGQRRWLRRDRLGTPGGVIRVSTVLIGIGAHGEEWRDPRKGR
jgi:hypothetical protein